MNGEQVSRSTRRATRWRHGVGAQSVTLDASELSARPAQEVRRFRVSGLAITAVHHSPGRWLLHSRSLSSEELAGLASIELERRPGAEGSWQ